MVTSSISRLTQLICLIRFVLKRSCWSNNYMKSIHYDLQWDGQTLSTVKRVRLDVAVQNGIKQEVSVYYHPIWRKCLNHVAFSLITLDICCTILISENIVQHFRILINFLWDVSVSLIDLFIFCVLREIHAGGPSTWPLPCFPQMAGNRKWGFVMADWPLGDLMGQITNPDMGSNLLVRLPFCPQLLSYTSISCGAKAACDNVRRQSSLLPPSRTTLFFFYYISTVVALPSSCDSYFKHVNKWMNQ